MVRGLALVSCVVSGACLEAPERGMPDDDVVAPPDRPGGGGGDGDGAVGSSDGGAPNAVLCADGSAADIVFPSLIQAPVGMANLDFTGIALLVNTGEVPIDTVHFLAIADDVPGHEVTPVITVGQLGDTAPVGQAVGQWGLAPALLEPRLPEPWTDTAQPRVDVSIHYDIPSAADFDVMMIVDQEAMGGAMPIHVQVAGAGAAQVVAIDRLPLGCTAE